MQEERTLVARLGESIGTNTLKKIFAPYGVEECTSTRDGYANVIFPDVASMTAAFKLAHYTPTGLKISLATAREIRETRQAAAEAEAAGLDGSVARGGRRSGLCLLWRQL